MSTTERAARAGNWFTRGGWWFFVHLLSAGILAPVPFVRAAVLTRRVLHVVLAALSVALAVTIVVLLGAADRDPAGKAIGPAGVAANGTIALLLFGGLAALVVVRHQTYGSGARPRPVPSGPPPGPDPAVAAVMAGRARRAEARRIVETDPLMAHELRIGRPDLARTYDDGGLVDLNTAPGPVLAGVLGPAVAERIVAARAGGRFLAVDDVLVHADLPVETWDVVRDRGIVLSS